ncbi:MAG: DUF2804 domain-containing protein [Oscillospiraceae bacterium]|nr:DUF2804 domain-containing protein [Oscillospiraceae bacterium]
MRNHEVTKVQPLLNSDGTLREPGWSRKMVQVYDRSRIKAPAFRIKEWDYYLVVSQKNEFAVALTISDDGYIGLQSASLLDFQKKWEHTETILNAFPMGKLKLPSDSSKGNTVYHDKRLDMEFIVTPGKRRLICNFKNFLDGKPFHCDITLNQPEMDSMVIATPWDKKGRFYYNQKINCMRACGSATFDGKTYTFDPETDFGTLDWGRGVWTYDNVWYWGSGNGIVNGKDFGFNIGYGFGNTAAATENILFYDGKCHKLDDVIFHIPEDSYLSPWRFSSSDGRFEMEFTPILDRAAKIDVKVIVTDQHQVFGRLNGTAILDDGTRLEVRDMLMFAEKVHNKY